MTDPHIVKSFDEALGTLHDNVARMGVLAEHQFDRAIQALVNRDADLAARVIAEDDEVDALEAAVNDQVVRVLCLRAPVADDLRVVVTAMKIASALERVADYSACAARRSMILTELPPLPSVRAIKRMGALVHHLLKEVMTAYRTGDAALALDVWNRDREVDTLYSSLFRELLTYMMEDPGTITAASHLMFIAKNVERIGDHATNIAEMIYYLVNATPIEADRPKGDTSSFATGSDV